MSAADAMVLETAPHEPSTVPAQRTPRDPLDVPRVIRTWTPDDWFSLVGTLLASLSLVTVVYEHLLDGSGKLGFLLVWYAVFLALYAAVLALSHSRPVIVDRLVTCAMWGAAAVVLLALATTVGYTFVRGWAALLHTNLYTQDSSGIGPTAPLTQGGILQAIVGTVIEVGIAVAVSVPLGIATAVYMAEVGGRGSRLVRTVVEAMTALPEILAGLFVYVALIVGLGMPKSGLAAAIAMSVTMVPIIARASEVGLRIVPSGLREASYALGSTKWRTVWSVTLPSARAGLATAAILGVARGVGETAVVLITSGSSSYLTFDPLHVQMNSLPLYIFTALKSGQPVAIERAFGAASVLLTIVLALFAATRLLSRDKAARR